MADLIITSDSSQVRKTTEELREAARQALETRKAFNQMSGGVTPLEKHFQSIGNQITTVNRRMQQQHMAFNRNTRSMGQMSTMTQQAGYQIGDFLVQVQSGTNWMVAFGQQATQVAGTLTLLGGKMVMIGTVLGIAIPLITALGAAWMRTRDSAAKTDSAFKAVAESIKEVSAVSQDLESSLGNSMKVAREEAEAFLRVFREIRGEQLESALNNAIGSLPFVQELRVFEQELEALTNEAMGGVAGAAENVDAFLENFRSSLGLSVTESYKLESILRQIGGTTKSEIADSFFLAVQRLEEMGILANEDVATAINNMANELGIVDEAFRTINDKISEAEAEAKLLEAGLSKGAIEALKLANVDIAAGISPAVGRAAELAAQLGIALNLAQNLARVGVGGETGQVILDPRDPRYDPEAARRARIATGMQYYSENQNVVTGFEPLPSTSSTRRGSRGGGGADPAERLRSQYDSLMGSMNPLIAAQNEFNAQQKMLNEALAAGAINGDEFRVAMEAITQKLTEAKDPLRDFKAGLEDALDPNKNYIKGLEALQSSLAEFLFNPFEVGLDGMVLGFSRALQKMASEALAAGFMKMLVGGGGGGFFGSFLGGLFANGGVFSNGNVRAFANGGVVGSPTNFPMMGNQVGLMGESGPEAIMPLKRASNGKLGVSSDGNSGGKSMKIINVLDSRVVGEYLNTPEGEEVIMNVMRRTGVV